jgi:FlaA1/EpsC-like NDP-sugar epimerase
LVFNLRQFKYPQDQSPIHTLAVSKDIIIAYSVLSTITIATVAIFDEFRPNDKLILYPLLFGTISSCILRLCYLVISKQCLKHGYRKKSVLLIGGGHAARQITAKILSTPELGFRIQGYCPTATWACPLKDCI